MADDDGSLFEAAQTDSDTLVTETIELADGTTVIGADPLAPISMPRDEFDDDVGPIDVADRSVERW